VDAISIGWLWERYSAAMCHAMLGDLVEPSTVYGIRCSLFQHDVVGSMVRHLDWGGHAFELVFTCS
jgi:hypothetical protein